MTMKNILDTIETTEKVYTGVVDHVNKKHVTLFEMTNNDNPDIVLLVISWRSTYEGLLKFSVFKDMFFPSLDIPVILIARKDIKSETPFPVISHNRQKRKTVRKRFDSQ